MTDRGLYLLWRPDATSSIAYVRTMKEHFERLSAAYRQQGKLFEADLFADGVDELEALELKMQKKTLAQSSQ
jgi:hypothetical protein